jgi:hypothetical protein
MGGKYPPSGENVRSGFAPRCRHKVAKAHRHKERDKKIGWNVFSALSLKGCF